MQSPHTASLSSALCKKKRKMNWEKSLLCAKEMGIRISRGLSATEALPLRRVKADLGIVEFIYHRIFEKLFKENFTVTKLELR